MDLETELPPFVQWWPSALASWLQVILLFLPACLVLSLAVSAVRHGPAEGSVRWFTVIKAILSDLVSLSPRRVAALARLAIHEAIHRKVLVAFVVFVLVMLFAGWYLDRQSNDPAKLYLSFVMTATTYLTLLLALFLSVFSLPSDISSRTIFTVVTKPVRPLEIVLGRAIGFSLIGTALLAATGIVSYVFVSRGLDHTHEVRLDAADAELVDYQGTTRRGRTSTTGNHHHEVFLGTDGNGRTSIQQGHWHSVRQLEGGEFQVGPPEGQLVARVPVRGRLTFIDRMGQPAGAGVSVGKEWTYRSYIEGGTLAAAIWHFDGLKEEMFPDGVLPIELNLRVFRTHKGEITRTVLGGLVLRNPRTGVASSARVFETNEFSIDMQQIGPEVTDNSPEGKTLNIFRDLVDEGKLEIELKCLEHAQFFGVAQPDLYLRARDASYAVNFAKGYVAIWLQMVLVTTFGVMYSTFLNGAVAMMATLATLICGFFTDFIQKLAAGSVEGGGPLEALYRILQQKNLMVELEPGPTKAVIETGDEFFRLVLSQAAKLMPDFLLLSDTQYVTHGFDIRPDLLLQQICITGAFLIPVVLIGFVLLKTREVAR